MTSQMKMFEEILKKEVKELQLRCDEHQNENDEQRQRWKEDCEPNEDGEYSNGMGGWNEFDEDEWKGVDEWWNDGLMSGFRFQIEYLEKLLNLITDEKEVN